MLMFFHMVFCILTNLQLAAGLLYTETLKHQEKDCPIRFQNF